MAPLIPPDGPLDAELVIVGRDPGWQEVRDGRPFVGASGKLLDEALAAAKLSRADVLVTNVCGVRPPGDDWSKHEELDVAKGVKALNELLVKHPRKVVLTLGQQATMVLLTGEKSKAGLDNSATMAALLGGTITELRGYAWEHTVLAPMQVVPSVHPAFIIRNWLPWRACLTFDVQKAARLLKHKPTPRRSHIVGSLLEARMLGVKLSEAPRLAVDIEQDAHNGIACVAFAADAQTGYVFDFKHYGSVVQELLDKPMPKIFMNGQYDTTMLKRHKCPARNWTDDIMVMWHACEPLIAGKSESGSRQTQKSLRFLASVLTNEPWWKDYDFQTFEEKMTLCATDARVTYECWERLQERLDDDHR